MAKFVCELCGYESSKWLGKCPSCGKWNTFKEVRDIKAKGKTWLSGEGKSEPQKLSLLEKKTLEITPTGIGELDRVLGKGIPRGSFILVGGDPGVGKSTLLLQVASKLSLSGKKILYVTAEESLEQLRDRALRLGVNLDLLYGFQEADLSVIISTAQDFKPDILILDSIQTVYHPEIPSVPGSVAQVRECGAELLRYAKRTGTSVIVVGHVTKDGTLAGPKTLEHMVDVVLHLEGDLLLGLRILRTTKNRFGSTNEIGVFEMGGNGLSEVDNPSRLFITETIEKRTGVSIIPLLEGQRPLLVEVQALAAQTPFSIPQRNTTGYDLKRLSMILAVLEKKSGISLRKADVFINVTGGLKITESAADLGVAVAIFSSLKKIPLNPKMVVVGEIGLGGEVRPVSGLSLRLEEAKRLGFDMAIVPDSRERLRKDMKIIRVKNLKGAIENCVG